MGLLSHANQEQVVEQTYSHKNGEQMGGVWLEYYNQWTMEERETCEDSQMADLTTTASELLELRLYPAALTAFTLNT